MRTLTTVLGRAGRDPEMRFTPAGKAVTNLSVAADVGFGTNKKTVWFRVTFWDKLAEVVNQYVGKGDTVYIEGELVPDETGGPRIWTKQDGTPSASFELNAQTFRFTGGKSDDARKQKTAFEPAGPDIGDGDDMPF